jgi:hypothetical protein
MWSQQQCARVDNTCTSSSQCAEIFTAARVLSTLFQVVQWCYTYATVGIYVWTVEDQMYVAQSTQLVLSYLSCSSV